MHPSCYAWVGETVRWHDLAALSTLEVGSFDVNGSVRDHFSGPYLGVDAQPGPGVDRVANAETLTVDLAGETWPVVISTEMFEHVARPWVCMTQLAAVCAPGGTVIVTARGYDERGCWPVHAYPDDLYRYSAGALLTLAEDAGLDVRELDRDPQGPGWFLLARKPLA